jgi:hypothetical protein
MLIGQHHCNMCAYAHVLNLLWYPIIEYNEPICRGEAPEWTKSLGLNHAAILSEIVRIVSYIGDTFGDGHVNRFHLEDIVQALGSACAYQVG